MILRIRKIDGKYYDRGSGVMEATLDDINDLLRRAGTIDIDLVFGDEVIRYIISKDGVTVNLDDKSDHTCISLCTHIDSITFNFRVKNRTGSQTFTIRSEE